MKPSLKRGIDTSNLHWPDFPSDQNEPSELNAPLRNPIQISDFSLCITFRGICTVPAFLPRVNPYGPKNLRTCSFPDFTTKQLSFRISMNGSTPSTSLTNVTTNLPIPNRLRLL